MNKREQNIIDFIHLQEIAKRVLVVIKRQRKKKLDSPEMDPLPSALMTAEELMLLDEDSTFYIFRTDTNAILARGITGYESAKAQSNKIRKQLGLKWDQVSFRSEKKPADKPARQNFGKGIVKQPGEHIYATPSNNLSRIRLQKKDWDEEFLG